METKEVASEPAERMAVTGRADLSKGLNSDLGLANLFFLKKKTAVANAKEKR